MSQSGKVALCCGFSEKCSAWTTLPLCSVLWLITCPIHALPLTATIVHMMGPTKNPVGFYYVASLFALAKLDVGVYVP